MADKVFVITGATSGIGKALAAEAARSGERVVLVARDPDRGNVARQAIAGITPTADLDVQLCDLSILSSVRNLAEILKSKYEAIDVLINNASGYRRKREVTVDGFEEMFAANHLGPFLLTNLLLEQLQAAVEAHGSARIVNITVPSTVPLDFEDLQAEKNFKSLETFGATRTANLLFTLELARRLEATGITVNAIHPGVARAGLSEEETSLLARLFARLSASSPEKAASTILQTMLAPEFERTTGKLLYDGKEIEAPEFVYDPSAQERLWEISERLTGLAATKGVTPINDPHLK
jgi:NAD(P)-dependent dehydrogenase (short-subunit alcohol dehydrogenase family)